MTAPQCCGLCHQGRRPCVTPEACHVPAATPPSDAIDALISVACWVVCVMFFVSLAATLVVLGGTA